MAAQLGTLTGPLRLRLRSAGARAGAAISSATYLRKWLLLGISIGAIAGLGAVAFYRLLTLARWVFLNRLVGYSVPLPAGEGLRAASAWFGRPWALPLVVGLGGLLSGLIVFRYAPEAEGHGTDAAIHAVHENPRGIRVRAVVVKLVASALTIGSGGSGGREGPTAQISAGFGSLLARLLNLTPADGRIAVSVGIGSGIGAIFGAPLGGAVLAAEIVYRDDIEVETLLPALIASIVSYGVFGAFQGFTPLFGFVAQYRLHDPLDLSWFAVIGVVAGLVGLLYAKGFYGIGALFSRLPLARSLRPALGGVAVGLLGLAVPEVLGTGYGWVQTGLSRSGLLHLPIAIVLLLPFLRILATGLSIGSGGSGGIFGPGIVIGAFLGGGVWRLLEPIAPGIPHSPAAFVIVGMMSCFGSIARAPLAVMIMVAEMTGSLQVLAPAMLAVGVATLIVRRSDDTIYRSQLRTRADSPAHRVRQGLGLLTNVTVAEVMSTPPVVVAAHQPAGQAVARLRREGRSGAPVVDERGNFVGAASFERLAAAAERRSDDPLDGAVDVTASTVLASATLDVALEALEQSSETWVSVLDHDQHVVGVFSGSDLVRGYRRALAESSARISAAAGNAVPVEVQVGPGSPNVGRTIRDAMLPPGTIVLAVGRGDALLFADGATVLQPGDVVTSLARPELADQLRAALGAPAAGGPVLP